MCAIAAFCIVPITILFRTSKAGGATHPPRALTPLPPLSLSAPTGVPRGRRGQGEVGGRAAENLSPAETQINLSATRYSGNIPSPPGHGGTHRS